MDVEAARGGTGTRVSVVMPAYNAAATLEASMRSVLDQSHVDLELLVIDDCSTDASLAIAERIAAQDSRVLALRLDANAGVAAARNAGLQAASGDWIAFLDSDDRWHPQKLRAQLEHLQRTGARVAYCSYQRVDEAGRVLSTVIPPARVDHAAMLKSNRIGNLTGIYHRSLGEARFQRIGHEDYLFWLQLVRRAGQAVRVDHPEPLAWYLVRPGSLSADKARAARWQWHIYRDTEKLGLFRAGWYFLHYAFNAVRKRG